MEFPRFDRQGPVAYWRPYEGTRHAMEPSEPPRPGHDRETLCGDAISVVEPTVVDWLAPTCAECWRRALRLRDARVAEFQRARGGGW